MTSEQLEASRAERMRLNGVGTPAFEDTRTWMEETGLCLFLPHRQHSSFVAPSFVEAVAGQRNPAPDAKQITQAEDLLIRLEKDDVAVRLNLLGQPGERPDFVVAAWVLPYVYALRGDRDWRRNPQLTGSRQVSPLAVETYKLLEAGDATIPQLKHALGREVTEQAVLRAITELWQQLRIIPVVSAPGQTAHWQLLRQRFQKAIAEGASTSQVTAISVLASIYLQAVIAASMEEVELFLAPLTARSKIREVLRGLVATRQVHTLQMGHAPHFYVAGTLPEFSAPPTIYASTAVPASHHFLRSYDREEEMQETVKPSPVPAAASAPPGPRRTTEPHTPRMPAAHKSAIGGKSAAARPHFSRSNRSRDRKPVYASTRGRASRRAGADARSSGARPMGGHSANGKLPVSSARWSASSAQNGNGKRNGTRPGARPGNGARSNGHGALPSGPRASGRTKGSLEMRKVTSTVSAGGQRNGRHNGHNSLKAVGKSAIKARGDRKPALAAGSKAGNNQRYGFTAPSRRKMKKRG